MSNNHTGYRKTAFEHFEEKCHACGSGDEIEVHHIDGDHENDSRSNLVPLCNRCHTSVRIQTRDPRVGWFESELRSRNALMRWLIRQKRWAKANRKMADPDNGGSCKNPLCDENAISESENGDWCWYRCKERWHRFVENIQEHAKYNEKLA